METRLNSDFLGNGQQTGRFPVMVEITGKLAGNIRRQFFLCYHQYSEQSLLGSKKTCQANSVGKNSSFIFTVCVKSVLRYHFKIAYVVLHIAVK